MNTAIPLHCHSPIHLQAAAPPACPAEADLERAGFDVLNTAQSVRMRPRLHAFESSVIGADFPSNFDDFAPWFASGDLLYAVICHPGIDAVPKIDALVSVLVADRKSCARLVEGKIAEHQLEPWSHGGRIGAPVIYFSTIICPQRQWQPLLYQSLLSDLLQLKGRHRLTIQTGLSIACTADGIRHLSKNGFVRLPGRKYLGKHSFLVISALSAKTTFWRALLSARPTGSSAHLDAGLQPLSPPPCRAVPARILLNRKGAKPILIRREQIRVHAWRSRFSFKSLQTTSTPANSASVCLALRRVHVRFSGNIPVGNKFQRGTPNRPNRSQS